MTNRHTMTRPEHCDGCGRRMLASGSRATLARSGSVRVSAKAQVERRLCVLCAHAYVSGNDTRIRPRYCTCAAYNRDPNCPEQCDQCWRRIDPALDNELPTTATPQLAPIDTPPSAELETMGRSDLKIWGRVF